MLYLFVWFWWLSIGLHTCWARTSPSHMSKVIMPVSQVIRKIFSTKYLPGRSHIIHYSPFLIILISTTVAYIYFFKNQFTIFGWKIRKKLKVTEWKKITTTFLYVSRSLTESECILIYSCCYCSKAFFCFVFAEKEHSKKKKISWITFCYLDLFWSLLFSHVSGLCFPFFLSWTLF